MSKLGMSFRRSELYDFSKFGRDAISTYYEDRDWGKKLSNITVQRVFNELKAAGLGKYKGEPPAYYKQIYGFTLADAKLLAKLVDAA